MIHWCICEYTSHVGVRTPQGMTDHLTTSNIIDVKAELSVALVGLKQSCIGVCSEILKQTQEASSYITISFKIIQQKPMKASRTRSCQMVNIYNTTPV